MRKKSNSTYNPRQKIIQIFMLVCAVLLLISAADLQLFDDTYQERARATTIDRHTLYPSRGLMYDRSGKLIVHNNAIYDLDVIYDNLDPDMDTALFLKILNIDKSTFVNNLEKDWNDIRYARNVPFRFLKKIPAEKFTMIAEYLHKFPGFIPRMRNIRGYDTESGAHVLGYISEVSEQNINDSSGVYKRGDYIGTSGLEKEYEKQLRGLSGTRYVLKDKWGHIVDKFDDGKLDSSAVSGADLTTSLDIDLQNYGEQLFQGKKGAAVAIEPKSGEILSLISSPNFPPQVLTVDRDRGREFESLINDTLQPFFNRAISAKYPPGSTFKPLLSLIALQEKVISPTERIRCTGGYSYKNSFWGCHSGGGRHNATTAIQNSCNTYFYSVYRRLIDKDGFDAPEKGLSEMNEYLFELGLGNQLGIDIPNESAGLIPTADYYNDIYSFQEAEWRSTYIISNGIGQGEMQLSTLQLAHMAAFIANKGFCFIPHVVKKINGTDDKIARKFKQKKKLSIELRYFDEVIEGMELAVESGTAGLARIPGVRLAGKTGTSQNPHGKDHSVFIAFAPVDDPQIAIAVYVENAGFGSTYAAPMASLMVEKYLNDTIMSSRKWIEKRMLEANLINLP